MNQQNKGEVMKAFTMGINKTEFMNEIRKHQAADAFVRGSYGNESKLGVIN